MSVRHIHTQAQALAELERQRAVRRASYARRKERTLNSTPAQAQAERERQRAAQKASHIRRKERILNDEQYREQELQRRKIRRDQKRKALEEDPLHVDARKDGDRMVKVRRLATETRDVLNRHDREEMIEKVRQRYVFSLTISLINTS
jgi:flagellar basal body rod protein FlgC